MEAARSLLTALAVDGATAPIVSRLGAFVSYSEWVVADENDVEARAFHAHRLLHQIDAEGVLAALHPARGANPRILHARSYLSEVGYEPEEIDAALEVAKEALGAYAPTRGAPASRYLALRQQDYVLQRLIGLDPEAVGLDRWLTFYDMAVEQMEELRRLAPQNRTYRNNLQYYIGRAAWAHGNAGNTAEQRALNAKALALARGILEAEPENRIVFSNAIIYVRNYIKTLEAGDVAAGLLRPVEAFAEAHIESGDHWEALLRAEDQMGWLSDDIEDARLRLDDPTEIAAFDALEAVAIAAQEEAARTSQEDAEATNEAREAEARTAEADTDAGLIEGTGEDAAEDTDVAPGWAHPSLYPTTWSTLEGSLDAEARDVLGPTLAGRGEEIRFFRAASALSFYETTTTLLEAQVDTPAGPGIRTALIASDSAFYPDGTTAPIYDANEASGLLLDHALAASAYLRFFLSHVGYDEGLALIVEHVDELFWTGAQQPEDIETARRALMPLTVREDPDRDGGWLAEGTISYDGDIYVAEMGISPEGEVSFVNTEVVAEDLPIHAIRFDERMDGLMPEKTDAGSKRLRVLDYERLGLTRIEDFADEASHVIEQSLELPHAVGTPLRARYAALLLSEEAEAAIANYPQLLNRISYDLLLEDESLTEAVDLARRAHEILPGDPYIADTYGWGLLKIGEVESAIILLELAASTANTTEAEILAHLGQAYRTAGRIEEAREALNAALAAEPTQIWADFIARELGRLGDG